MRNQRSRVEPRLELLRSQPVAIALVILAVAFTYNAYAARQDRAAAQVVRLSEPRIETIERSEWSEEQREILSPLVRGDRTINVFKTMWQHPELYRGWRPFFSHILGSTTLPTREREILILRIGWLCGAEYEWGQHARIGRRAGLSDEELRGITEGPAASTWNDFDSALLTAVDELHADAFITDATWNALAERYSKQQLMDLVFTVGQYNLVSMALNSFGVQPEEGLERFPQ